MSKFALLFLLVFFGGIGAALMYSSAAAFGVYQLVYLLNPDDRWWSASIPGLRYSLIASILMLLVLGLRYKELTAISPWFRHPTFKWILFLLLLYAVSLSYALVQVEHKKFLIDFLKLVVVIFVAYKLVNNERSLDFILWVYCIGCGYIGYLAWTVGRNSQGRVEGIGFADGHDANGVAAAIAPSLVLLLYYFWQGSVKFKVFSAFFGALIANGLVLINSRGSFLAVVISSSIFVLFMVFSRFQKKGQKATALFVVIFGVSGALYVTDDLFWERMGTLQNISEDEGRSSGASRTEFWLATFPMIADHPKGLGISGFQLMSSQYIREDIIGGVEYRAVHSSWFQVLSELGWLGPIILALVIFSLFKSSAKAKKYLVGSKDHSAYFKVLAIECSVVSYFVAATFIDRVRAEVFWWVVLFLMIATNVYYLKKVAKGGAEKFDEN